MARPSNQSAEMAVRRYLTFLGDPGSLRDDEAIAALEAKAAATSDVMERLHVLSDLERAKVVDVASVQEPFIRHAKAYAQRHQITAAAFRSMGVPADVLTEAGLDDDSAPVKAKRRTIDSVTDWTVTKLPAARPPVPAGRIQTHIVNIDGPFRVSDVVDALEANPQSVRLAINQLTASGVIERTGTDPEHRGPGRAPIVYRRAPKRGNAGGPSSEFVDE